MADMNYKETLEYLYEKLPMFSRVGAAALKNDLSNTMALCEALGNPQNTFKSIHIAGTNGKGSTSHQLAAILQLNGHKTGLYTSPHLKDFRERIKVNGMMCKEEFVVDFVQKIRPVIEAINPSFFEVTVAMAFYYFSLEKVDIAIIEVGLGGRLDSTNIITPILSIITNIGYDHMQLLGNTLTKIAYEKAGIIKPNIPIIIGEYLPETIEVFLDKSTKENAPIFLAQDLWIVEKQSYKNHVLEIKIQQKITNEIFDIQLDLAGLYQSKNIKAVLEACHHLSKMNFIIEDAKMIAALQQVKQLTGLHGRWEIIHKSPDIVVDVAHNVDGMKQVLLQLKSCDYKNLHIVLGMVKDKDIESVLKVLPQKATYYFTNAPIERALLGKNLQIFAAKELLMGNVFENVDIATENALANASSEDLIIVCGSVFLVGEINLFGFMKVNSKY